MTAETGAESGPARAEPRALPTKGTTGTVSGTVPLEAAKSWENISQRTLSHCGSSFESLVPLPEMGEDEVDGHVDDGRNSRTDSLGQEAKDSGIECFDDFPAPDPELVERVVAQLEAYFCDENLSKDAFLLKHIRRNKEGYVSLKLVSSFRKVKSITKDWKVVAFGIKNSSQKLICNDNFTKVRRVDTLPVGLAPETPKSRTIVAYNMTFEKPSVANVSQLFASYGDIASVRIYKDSLPPNCLQYTKAHPELNKSVCAVVEFENPASAETAVKGLENDSKSNWRSNLKVFLLEVPSLDPKDSVLKESSNKTAAKKKPKRDTRSYSVSASVETSGSTRAPQDEITSRPRAQTVNYKANSMPQQQQKQYLEPQESRLRPYHFQPRQKSNSYSCSDERETIAPRDQNNLRAVAAFNSANRLTRVPENLVRLPIAPDGSRGFKVRGLTKSHRSQSEPLPLNSQAS